MPMQSPAAADVNLVHCPAPCAEVESLRSRGTWSVVRSSSRIPGILGSVSPVLLSLVVASKRSASVTSGPGSSFSSSSSSEGNSGCTELSTMSSPGFASAVALRLPSTHAARCKRQTVLAPRMVLRAPADAMALSTMRTENLPWSESVGGPDVPLLFMPFVEHQLEVMEDEFEFEDLPFPEELSLQLSTKKPARIESWQWKSEDFRKIRATYIDAGLGAQVFNSVWYPSPVYDAPLLGIDFLSFGKKKVICVLDFQPLVQDEDYLKKYCEPIAYIKEKYEGIAGTMSKRFYDETQFFSKQLAFARFSSPEPVMSQLYPAFKEYLRDYVQLIKGLERNEDEAAVQRVLQLHKEYDVYSAERDPAIGLFSTYWGKEWANRFTHEFLFSDSEMPTESPAEPAEDKEDALCA